MFSDLRIDKTKAKRRLGTRRLDAAEGHLISAQSLLITLPFYPFLPTPRCGNNQELLAVFNPPTLSFSERGFGCRRDVGLAIQSVGMPTCISLACLLGCCQP